MVSTIGGLIGAQANTKRGRLIQRWQMLTQERESWMQHWSEITQFLLPRSGRYFADDRNRGHRRHHDIIDNTGGRSLRVLAAGLMAGATSPARPWFALTTTDPELAKFHPVREWLDDTQQRLMRAFAKSNTYRALHQMYEELGAFGSAVSLVVPDFERVIHHHPITVGQFCLQADYAGRVNTMFREFEVTVGQLVREFGINRVSESSRHAFNAGNLETAVRVVHAVEPRDDRNPRMLDNRNMPWRSIYFELSGNHDEVLRESGFRNFPVLAPRWAVAGGDIYGHGPGMEALGDIQSLQTEQIRKGQAIDYMTLPPIQIPGSLTGRDVHAQPGGKTILDKTNPNEKIQPLWEVRLDLNHLLEDIRDTRERINGSFFADLFLMLAHTDPRQQMTATEVAERHEEKLLMLGPVLERLHNELLEPLIDMTFDRMLEVGALLPPPPELEGTDLSIEFVSMLAQAQRAIGTNSIDRFIGITAAAANLKPNVVDKVDLDAMLDNYSRMLGVPPEMIVPDDEVAKEREARARAEQAADQTKLLGEQGKAMKDLSAAKTGGTPSALDAVAQFSSLGGTPAALQ